MTYEINVADEKIYLNTWHVATITPGLPALIERDFIAAIAGEDVKGDASAKDFHEGYRNGHGAGYAEAIADLVALDANAIEWFKGEIAGNDEAISALKAALDEALTTLDKEFAK